MENYENLISEYSDSLLNTENLHDVSGKVMQQLLTRGNVNLLTRPQVDASTLIAAGWTDAGTGTATVYTTSYSTGSDGVPYPADLIIHITPIMADGSVKTPSQLDSYIDSLLANKNPETILYSDNPSNGGSGLVLWVQKVNNGWDPAWDDAGLFDDVLHLLQAAYYLEDYSSMPEPGELQTIAAWFSKVYKFYVKNYTRNGSYITDETLLYSIPMEQGEENVLVDPKIQCEMGKAGSFEFTMNPGHPYFEAFKQMKTIFRFEYDGDTLFRGRVLTIDTNQFTGVKKVHCEGDLAFFLDSQQEGISDNKRPKTTALAYLTGLINAHNSQMNEDMPDKKFVLGEVPGKYSSAIAESQKVNPDNDYRYGSGSWRDTQSALNELSDAFGGFFRTRYQNGTVYLDWLDNYFSTEIIDQPMELGENMIDINSSSEVNNIFTALIPVGSSQGKNIYIDGYKTDIHGNNKRILVPQITRVYSEAQLNQGFHSKQDYENAINDYGIIYRTETFSNADTKAKLWSYAIDWIKNNYCGGLTSFSIGALDMHVLISELGKYIIGKRVPVIYPDVDKRETEPGAVINKTLTIMSATYDVHHPDKNSYTVGIPNGILKRNYGEKKSTKKSSGAGPKKKNDKNGDDIDIEAKKREELMWAFIIDSTHNSADYQKYVDKYGIKAGEQAQQAAYIAVKSQVEGSGEYYSLLLDGHNKEFVIKGAPYSEAGQRYLHEMGEAAAAIVLNGDQSIIELKQPLPDSAVRWEHGTLAGFNNVVAKIGANTNGGKIELGKVTGQSDTSPGQALATALVDGAKGALGGTNIALSNGLANINDVIDGDTKAMLDLKGPTSEILGGDGVKDMFNLNGLLGSGKFGKTEDGGDEDWLVFLNKKVTYTDKNGNQQTKPGFVTAADFADLENEIPSFKTKLAVVDTLIAGKASIGELQAVRAKIDTIEADYITASSIKAGTSIRTDILNSNTGRITNLTTASLTLRRGNDNEAFGVGYISGIGNSQGTSYIILKGTQSTSSNLDLSHNHQITIAEEASTGRMKVTLGGAIATTGNTDNIAFFKIADTTAYKNGVSAARTAGRAEVNVAKGDWSGGVITFSPVYGSPASDAGGSPSILSLQMNLSKNSTNNAVGVVKVQDLNGGTPKDTGASHNVYLHCKNDYAYITTNSTTPESTSSSNVIAFVANPKPDGQGTIDSASISSSVYDTENEQYNIKVTITGTNLTNSGEEVELAVSASAAINAGIAKGEAKFTPEEVTVQGAAYGEITPINESSKMWLGNATNIRAAIGTGVTPTKHAVSVATRNGSYNTRTGSALKLKFHGDTTLYVAPTSGATGYKRKWYYVDDDGTSYYKAGTDAPKYTLTPATYYDVGSAYEDKKLYETIDPVTYRRVLDAEGGTTFYTAGTAVSNLRRPGTKYTNRYYTKNS